MERSPDLVVSEASLMSRTPDAHEGIRYEDVGVQISPTSVDASVEGELRNKDSEGFSFCDASGEFKCRGKLSDSPEDVTKNAASVGTSIYATRADHKHDVSVAAPGSGTSGQSPAEGSATSLARSDHVHGSPSSWTPSVHATSHESGGVDVVAHGDLSNVGTNTHSQIDSHLGSTSNPHSDEKSDIGLSDVTNDAQLKGGAGDFYSIVKKKTLASSDIILIEDSVSSYAKKKILKSAVGSSPLESNFGWGLHAGSTPYETWYPVGKIGTTSDESASVPTGYLWAVPFIAPIRGGTLDRISVYVTTGVGSSRVARFAIYNCTSGTNVYPGSRLLVTSYVSVRYAGHVSVTINQALSPGTFYYAAITVSSGIGSPAMWCIPASVSCPYNSCGQVLGNSLIATSHSAFIRATFTYAEPPDPFPAGASYVTLGVTYCVPVIYLRF